MTGTLTAAGLVGNSEFVGFCFCWERDRRIPVGFPDWLREQGLEEQAQTADWCLNSPDKEGWGVDRGKWGGPIPSYSEDGWGWYWRENPVYCKYGDDLYHPDKHMWVKRPTFPEAIAYLLDHYRPE
jgi:hypothetical protein